MRIQQITVGEVVYKILSLVAKLETGTKCVNKAQK